MQCRLRDGGQHIGIYGLVGFLPRDYTIGTLDLDSEWTAALT
jgi:hypothetical protein